jgi:nitrite reductase/ring-hydroxylating ferredoxin subunit
MFTISTGARISGPSKKGLTKVSHRISKGILLATLKPAPSATASPSEERALAKTSAVPVGSGLRVESPNGVLIVVQPTKGEFSAFSAVCTHAGCEVGSFTRESLICNCHGSEFSTFDGAVSMGPARLALKQYQIEVRGEEIYLKP